MSTSVPAATGATRSPDILASPAVTLSRVIAGRLNANLRLQRPQNSVYRFNDVLIDNTNVHRPLSPHLEV